MKRTYHIYFLYSVRSGTFPNNYAHETKIHETTHDLDTHQGYLFVLKELSDFINDPPRGYQADIHIVSWHLLQSDALDYTDVWHPDAKAIADEDLWAEHPLFLRRIWQQEVYDNNTQRGYWSWVCARLEQRGL